MLIYALNDRKRHFAKRILMKKIAFLFLNLSFCLAKKANSQGFFELCKHLYHSQSVKFAVG